MPRWFFWVCGLAIGVAWLLPYPPVKFALLVIFGLIFLSFYNSAPERTLFLFLLGMPVLDLIPQTMSPIPGLNAESIIIVALFVAASKSQARQPGPPLSNPFNAPIAYYVAIMVFSAIRSFLADVDTGAELFSSIKNQLFFVFLAPIAFRLIHNKEQLHNALKLIAATCTIVSLHAIWLTRAGVLSGLMLERNRASGLVAGQPNLFGGFLAMMILIYAAILLGNDITFRERLGYVITLVSMAGALLMTLSRGSWLALLLAFGVLSLLRGARAIVLVLVVVLSSPLWLPEKVVERVQHTFSGRHSTEDQELEDSAQVRVDQWKALPQIWGGAPLFGYGFQTFRSIWAKNSHDNKPKAAHSTWVEFLVEEGVLGILAYLWLLGLLGFTAFRAWLDRGGGIEGDLALGFTCAIFCLALLDMSGTRFRNREVMAYIWVLGGALARGVAERRRGAKARVAATSTLRATTIPRA